MSHLNETPRLIIALTRPPTLDPIPSDANPFYTTTLLLEDQSESCAGVYYNFFVCLQVCLITVVYPVIVFCISYSIALPFLPSNVGRPLQWTVLRPDARPFLRNSQGSVHIWDTKTFSRKVNPVSQMPNNKFDGPFKTTRRNNVKRPSSKSPINFRDNNDTPILFPDRDFPSRNQHAQNTNAWFDGEGIEQRMLLPKGYSIPEEMYGPNYIWDTKGWPRRLTTTEEPIYNHLKGSTRNNVSYDSPIIRYIFQP